MLNNIKTVVITGAGRGLGLELARVHARKGYRLVLADIDSAALQKGAEAFEREGFEVLARSCDVRRPEDVQSLLDACVERWGVLNRLINNAGVAVAGAMDAVPVDDWRWVFDINLMGVVHGCHAAARIMKDQGHGQIVNIASLAGLLTLPGMSAYNASKAAVVSLSETLHAELIPWGIEVSVVCPSFFKTGLGQSLRCPDAGAASQLERLMQSSRLNADAIAKHIVEAVDQHALHILPHPQGAYWWRLKRLSPAIYDMLMRRVAYKQYRHQQRNHPK